MRSVFVIRRDTPVDSKVYYHPVFALSQCAQIIDRYKFFLFTTRAPQSNLDYNLGQNRMGQQTPIPNQDQSRTKPHKSPNGPFFPSLAGGGGVYSELCNCGLLSNFRAITRLETLATQATLRAAPKLLSLLNRSSCCKVVV